MSIFRKILSKSNAVAKKYSHWYNEEIFSDCGKFWRHSEFDLEVINLGSSSAKNCFNYSGLRIKAANWACSPQSFVGDYAILTNYCSYLKEGATVLIPICLFSSLGGGNDDLADKYYSIVRPISIPHASLRKRDEIMMVKNAPLRYIPFFSMLSDIKSLFKKGDSTSCKDYKADAERWINAWKKEFSLYNLNDSLSLINKDRFEDSVKALQNLLLFSKSHGFKPVIVVPPVTEHLLNEFNTEAQRLFVANFIEQSNLIKVPVLSYVGNPEFSGDEYFRNAFLMNEKGAAVLTNRVLSDLGLTY